jgi:exodeoxyribonuclease V alpha subunit
LVVIERLAVTSILSDSWGGTIFAGRNPSGQIVRIRTWEATSIAIGDVVEIEGTQTTFSDQHGRHRQIDATTLSRTRTSGRLIVPWLMTLNGIGRARAQMLFDHFGDAVVELLGKPSNLAELAHVLSPTRPSIGRKLAEYVLAQFAARSAAEDIGISEIHFLRRLEQVGIADRRAARALWRLIGSRDAYARLLERPYAAAAVIPWREADALGLKLLRSRGVREPAKDEERYVGAVDAAWRLLLRDGHTAADRNRLELLLKRWGIPGIAVDASLTRQRTVKSRVGQLRAPGASFLERSVATAVVRLRRAAPYLDWIAHPPTGNVELTTEQSRAIASVRARGFTVLQGGAGVGKTTAMRALCDWHVASGGTVIQTAIAGKAALRLSRATGRLALTVAKLLSGLEKRRSVEAEGGIPSEQLPRMDMNTLLVVDEASMVDLVSWRRLLEAVPSGARVVAAGDVAQLPPVGLGRVFHDLVADGADTETLSMVMRQAAGSPIVSAAGHIRDGSAPPPARVWWM